MERFPTFTFSRSFNKFRTRIYPFSLESQISMSHHYGQIVKAYLLIKANKLLKLVMPRALTLCGGSGDLLPVHQFTEKPRDVRVKLAEATAK